MSDSIRLSPSHGVNPSILCCFACDESYGVALLGRLKPTVKKSPWGMDVVRDSDPEAPHMIRGDDLCDRCRKIVADGGVLLIECLAVPGDAGTVRDKNAQRTGRMWGITGEAFTRIFSLQRPEKGVAFIDPEAGSAIFGPKEGP